jgi:peptidoglycan L-alanyl-D-glutamate endopeptidase CwlK
MNDIAALVTPAMVYPLFPSARRANIDKYLPPILAAMHAQSIGDHDALCIAFGTIAAETKGFVPISEGVSHFNTLHHPFDLYDFRHDLGNKWVGDGEKYKGRGFVQLTGYFNYLQFGNVYWGGLYNHPEMANDPVVAANLLAAFIKAKEPQFRAIIAADTGEEWADTTMAALRHLVNGGRNGLDAFSECFAAADRALP